MRQFKKGFERIFGAKTTLLFGAGYRPVVLPSTKTVAENPFPLSAYEKEKLFRQCGVRLPDVFGEISRP